MRVVLVDPPSGRRLLEWLLVLLVPGGLALACHAARIRICLLRSLTGMPCPTCGATRASLALARGDWHAAWFYHPLAAGVFIAAALYVCGAAATLLLTRRIPALQASRGTWLGLAIVLVLLVVVNWIYQF